jgi:hypothetical protein
LRVLVFATVGGAVLVGLALFARPTHPQGAAARPPLPVTVSDGGRRTIPIDVVIDCSKRPRPIHPEIYGIGFDVTGFSDTTDVRQWQTGAGARRFGGNASSRYDWELGTYNHGSDYLFVNDRTPGSEPLYASFLREDAQHGVTSAVTIPILGWVAKDATSVSFPLSRYPSQAKTDARRGAGDGHLPDGRVLPSPPQSDTSLAETPEMQGRWVDAMARIPDSHARTYILDNEPGLWNSTHRDVHPTPMTYDELLERTVAYAHALRAHDPQGKIAGPASYGWPDYFFSGNDVAAGVRWKPDRRMHEDLPLLAYYLRELHRHEERTHERLLDLLDVHFYAQGENLGIGRQGAVDPATRALRVRQTRGLWDPSYVDESWIREPVRLLPRLKEWIDAYDPGVGIQIGEWSYGAEEDISSGLAVAETLGRFADNGVAAAYYWTYPAPGSAAMAGFRAFRDFDGRGGRFLDLLAPVDPPGNEASVWVSRDAEGKHLVVVLLALAEGAGVAARLHVSSCGVPTQATAFQYAEGSVQATPVVVEAHGTDVQATLPAYSMTTVDVRLR